MQMPIAGVPYPPRPSQPAMYTILSWGEDSRESPIKAAPRVRSSLGDREKVSDRWVSEAQDLFSCVAPPPPPPRTWLRFSFSCLGTHVCSVTARLASAAQEETVEEYDEDPLETDVGPALQGPESATGGQIRGQKSAPAPRVSSRLYPSSLVCAAAPLPLAVSAPVVSHLHVSCLCVTE